MKDRVLLILLILGFIFRLSIATLDYRGDVHNHIAWGKDVVKHGVEGFYSRTYFPKKYGTANPNYPPLSILIFGLSYWSYNSARTVAYWLNDHVRLFPSKLIFIFDNPKLLPAFMKIPAIVADIGIAYIIYLIALSITNNKLRSRLVAAFILFNPAFFYNCAWWGQIESIPIFFTLLSMYFILISDHIFLSAILFVCALLSKQTALVFSPIIALCYLKKYEIHRVVRVMIAALVIFVALFLPFMRSTDFFLVAPFVTYWTKIATVSGLFYASNHAYNMWGFVTGMGKILDTQSFIGGVSYKTWGNILTGGFVIFIIEKCAREKLDLVRVARSSFLISLVGFLFLTRMHERHLQQTLPFLLILTLFYRNMTPIFIIVSFISFLNLYDGWWSPPIPIVTTMLSTPITGQIMALVLLILFIFAIIGFERVPLQKKL